jgi:hypothetical protein
VVHTPFNDDGEEESMYRTPSISRTPSVAVESAPVLRSGKRKAPKEWGDEEFVQTGAF